MRRLLLLLTAALSIHCKVKQSGLGVFSDDAGSPTAADTAPFATDGSGPGTGGQGGNGTGRDGSDLSPDGAAPGGGGGAGGNRGAGGTPAGVDARAADATSLATGGNGGGVVPSGDAKGPMGGTSGLAGSSAPATTATGGQFGPSGLGGVGDAGDGIGADAADLPVLVDTRPLEPPDAPADLPIAADDIADAAAKDSTDTGTLIWSDEFEGPKGSPVDSSKWGYVLWGPNTVNGEKQQYTDSLDNVFLDGDGHVVIRALKAGLGYTSGRIDTQGKFAFKTGRLEVRAKLPAGQGSFPGIIALGTEGNWPECGEIAVMEQYGQAKDWFYAGAYADTLPNSGDKRNNRYTLPDATTASSDFHVYSADWYTDHLVFQVDGNEVTRTSFGTSSPFYSISEYITLDVAVGGTMGGAIDPSAFPMDMVVDYVRVYAY